MMATEALEPDLCECGKVEGTWACKVQHIHLNSGAAKASND